MIDKRQVMDALRARLARELDSMARAQRNTAEGATHAESRAENDKDTRGLESSYLARGQAERVIDLRDGLARLDGLGLRAFVEGAPIALGALVHVESDDGERVYFLAPSGGGERLRVGATEVLVVTPSSPVGRALLGKTVGDEVELRSPAGVSRWEIVNLS